MTEVTVEYIRGTYVVWGASTVEHFSTFLFPVGKAVLPEEEGWFVMRPCPRYEDDP